VLGAVLMGIMLLMLGALCLLGFAVTFRVRGPGVLVPGRSGTGRCGYCGYCKCWECWEGVGLTGSSGSPR
jgi:hypothetical protein